MINLPSVAEPTLMSFSIAFTGPTFQRSLVLLVGARHASAATQRQPGDQGVR